MKSVECLGGPKHGQRVECDTTRPFCLFAQPPKPDAFKWHRDMPVSDVAMKTWRYRVEQISCWIPSRHDYARLHFLVYDGEGDSW